MQGKFSFTTDLCCGRQDIEYEQVSTTAGLLMYYPTVPPSPARMYFMLHTINTPSTSSQFITRVLTSEGFELPVLFFTALVTSSGVFPAGRQ